MKKETRATGPRLLANAGRDRQQPITSGAAFFRRSNRRNQEPGISQRILGALYLMLAALMLSSAFEPTARPQTPSRAISSRSSANPSPVVTAASMTSLRPITEQEPITASRTQTRRTASPSGTRRRWDASDRNPHARPPKGGFVRFFRMTATAYTPINTRMEGGRYTKTEKDGRSEHGVAVDTDLIPLGTRLWIPGYGHATADDIGGRIQGHRVDLRMQDEDRMRDWGVRPVRVYVLEEPSDPEYTGK
jgi:3D (Asp-Asp-Asp) domain-containing protein